MSIPSPLQIRAAIAKRIAEDFEKNGYDGPELPIPVRINGIIDQAFTDANTAAEKEAVTQ